MVQRYGATVTLEPSVYNSLRAGFQPLRSNHEANMFSSSPSGSKHEMDMALNRLYALTHGIYVL